jgi:hypothetical protein
MTTEYVQEILAMSLIGDGVLSKQAVNRLIGDLCVMCGLWV